MKTNGSQAMPATRTVRCAIYTRKSSEEGLEQEFNSLHAQREAAEAFIQSQRHEGWQCLPIGYDDGGFTGGNMDRPGLNRLLRDIEAGQIDCVIVYKVDRLSRSLLDFARMMATFEKYKISFVAVTQQFNTATSMGRLVLNVLLSFAQFEREIISERTRDKIAATRRKGKWSGGHPLLGYDVDDRSKLMVNDEEAQQVRTIFERYLEVGGLIPLVQELEQRGWRTKCWRTRKGHDRGGKTFTKTSLHRLLSNVTYLGKVRYKREVHAGEHVALIDPSLWQRVQARLSAKNHSGNGKGQQPKGTSLLKGLLHCACCHCAMVPSQTTKANRCYRYYVCSQAQKRGWITCPTKSVPANAIERFVLERLQALNQDPTLHPTREDIQQKVERIDYDGREGKVAITFHSAGDHQVSERPPLEPCS